MFLKLTLANKDYAFQVVYVNSDLVQDFFSHDESPLFWRGTTLEMGRNDHIYVMQTPEEILRCLPGGA